MTDIQVGDRIRITYEGEVQRIESGYVKLPAGHFSLPLEDEGKVTVLEKRKPKVGDVLNGPDAYLDKRIPIGTVASSGDAGLRVKTARGWLIPENNYIDKGVEFPRRILFIPD